MTWESIRMPHWTKLQAAWFNFIIPFQNNQKQCFNLSGTYRKRCYDKMCHHLYDSNDVNKKKISVRKSVL